MEKPPIKDKAIQAYVDYLEEKLRMYQESPYDDSYLACLKTISNWNRQLSEKEIDIFGEDSKQKFEMAHKYLTEQKPYIEQLEYLRSLMNPEQEKELKEKLKMDSMPIAEKIAMNGKK